MTFVDLLNFATEKHPSVDLKIAELTTQYFVDFYPFIDCFWIFYALFDIFRFVL